MVRDSEMSLDVLTYVMGVADSFLTRPPTWAPIQQSWSSNQLVQ